MLTENFRPWGRFDWVRERLPNRNWCFLGCLGTEDRFESALVESTKGLHLDDSLFINVVDKGTDYLQESNQIKEQHEKLLKSVLTGNLTIKQMGLLDSPKLLKNEISQFLDRTNGKILFDISCFPKRYFFPALKLLYVSERVTDLIVCYTVPDSYHAGDLAENPLPWARLPMFQRCDVPSPRIEKAIVGVGFLPFGLPSLLKSDYNNASISLLFPFPPGPPHYQRAWEFVREIEKSYPLPGPQQILRVDVKDVSGCYEHLNNITDGGSKTAILAPYGPKTHSLAMALFAINNDCDVYYTQPEQYHPRYSVGVKMYDGIPEVYAYCLKVGGCSLY